MKEDRKKKKKSGGKVQVKEKHKKKNKKNRVGEEFLEEESEEWPEEESEEWIPEEESEEWPQEEAPEEWLPEEESEEWPPEEDPQNSAIEVIEIGDDMFEDDVEPEAEEYAYDDEPQPEECDAYDDEPQVEEYDAYDDEPQAEEYDAYDGETEAPLSEDLTGNETLAAPDEEEDYMDELIRSKKLENQLSLAQKRGQDERAMIREQERLAQEKKRKKRGKRRNIIIGTVAAVLVVGIWFVGWGYHLIFGTDTAATTVEIVVGSGQEVVYAKLTSVKGNEITYTVAEAVETVEDADTEDTAADGEVPSDSADGEIPSGTTDGELPEGFDGEMSGDFDGDLPEGFDGEMSGDFDGEMSGDFDGELPEGFDGELPSGGSDSTGSDTAVPSAQGQSSSTGSVKATSLTASSADSYTTVNLGRGGDMGGGFSGEGGGGSFDRGSSDFDSSDFSSFGDSGSAAVISSASDTFTYNDVTYQLTDESNIMLIPVGTDVTTRLGTVTTFSRLAAGDCVALVMQEVDGENVIMAVYIIG